MLKHVIIDKELTKQLQKQEKERKKKEFFEKSEEQYEPKVELPTCILVDIDGTLAQRGSRDPYDFEKCGQDIIRAQVRYVSNLVKRDKQISVVILTGREEKWRTIVEKWLADNEVEYDLLLMRALDDHRPDYVIKREIFDAKIRDKYRVFFIMDDRKQVKKMWVRMGLFVFDCNQTDEVF